MRRMDARPLLHLPRGFLMGSADVVPGVSGGTIALVLNIYPRLVRSIRAGSSALGSLARADLADVRTWLGRVEWSFLVPLLAGILLAVFSLAHAIEVALERYPVQMAALFLGLVAGSVVIAWRLLTRRDGRHLLLAALVGAAVFALLGITPAAGPARSPAGVPLWAYLASGAVAICAMILPGISGSFILVMLGMYAPVLAAVSGADLGRVAVFATGAAVGLGLFSQVLHWALENHYDGVIAALIGLMIGSIRVLWPWPDGVDSTQLHAPDSAVGAAALLAVLGLAVVLAVTWVSERVESIEADDEARELRS
jgi:putative membrane protein